MPLRALFAACIAALVGAPYAAGQFWSRSGDQLTLTINHPAAVKAKIDHIAFTEPKGPCSTEFSDALVADFATSGAVVIDRLHLKNLAAEHKVNVSGMVDAKTAAKIGKFIGAGSLVFVNVHECKTYRAREANHNVDMRGNISKEQVPTTRGALKASVQIVDLATGVTVAARVVDAKVAVQALDNASLRERLLARASSVRGGSDRSGDDYPPDDQALSALFAEAVTQVHRALLPWTETKKITFYDDRECGLGAAYHLLQTSDYEGAANEALASVEKCKATPSVKPAQLARAHFNRAMTLYLLEDYLGAMAEFGNAVRLDAGNKHIASAMQECNRAWSAMRAQGMGQAKPATPRTSTPATNAPATSTKTAKTAQNGETVEERLKKLEELHKKKLITNEEYARKRQQILDDV